MLFFQEGDETNKKTKRKLDTHNEAGAGPSGVGKKSKSVSTKSVAAAAAVGAEQV